MQWVLDRDKATGGHVTAERLTSRLFLLRWEYGTFQDIMCEFRKGVRFQAITFLFVENII